MSDYTNRCGTCQDVIQPLHMGQHLANAHSVGDAPGAQVILLDMAVCNPYRLTDLEGQAIRVRELQGGVHAFSRIVEYQIERGILTAWEAELVLELERSRIERLEAARVASESCTCEAVTNPTCPVHAVVQA